MILRVAWSRPRGQSRCERALVCNSDVISPDNDLIDLQGRRVADVEASRAVRQAEVGAARTMLERTAERFGFKTERLAGDGAYGSAEMLHWLV